MPTAHAPESSLASQASSSPATTKCRRCGDVIGVYEPMIVIADGQARKTARAAEKESVSPDGKCYHDACHALECEPKLKTTPRPLSSD
jgi:hypothetical protein